MNELNRKLAKWMGYEWRRDGYYKQRFEGVWDCKSLAEFNFTDPEFGIAHCFKWLVPVLKINGFTLLSIEFMWDGDWVSCRIVFYATDETTQPRAYEERVFLGVPYNGNLAEALCLATEELIDA